MATQTKQVVESVKPWKVEPFTTLRPVQVYDRGGLCQCCHNNPSKFMFATPDNRALDLCWGCTEEAFTDGAFPDKWCMDNHKELTNRNLMSSSSWNTLKATQKG